MTDSTHAAASPKPRRILAFTGTFLPGYKGGGPIKSMVQILDHLPDSVKVTLVTADRDLGDSRPYPGLSGKVVHRGPHEIYYLNRRDPRHWMALHRWARRNPVDLIYVNSLWSPLFTVLPIVAHWLGLLTSREILLAPRGELSPGALGIKSQKKTAFLRIWAPLLRRLDPVWHASTEMEAGEIHQVFPWARTVIQIDSHGDDPRKDIVASRQRVRFVFIGRICEKKNLRLVLQALNLVTSEVEFDIYGPIEDAKYWADCRRLIDESPVNVRSNYRGLLRSDQVPEAFAQYDGFIFPTLGENFGHVIAECLSAGCPVICSQHTPWTGTLNHGGGVALSGLEAQLWADEIDLRARQSSIRRDGAKRNALRAYVEWRNELMTTSAVESVLDGLPREGSDIGSGRPARRAWRRRQHRSGGQS